MSSNALPHGDAADPMDGPLCFPSMTRRIEPAALPVDGRCTADSKQSGRQCRNKVAHPGANVCRMHGGAAPQVIAAADERMARVRDEALARLFERVQPGSDEEAAVLLNIVDKLTGKIQLLRGEATDRKESRHATLEVSRVQILSTLDRLRDRHDTRIESLETAVLEATERRAHE